jgi:natural product precursor
MKTREFNKKLSLNKKTIVHLHTNEMGDIKGGDTSIQSFCCTLSKCLTYCGPAGAYC